MSVFKAKNPAVFSEPHGSRNYPIFNYGDAPFEGVCAADAEYPNKEYPHPGVHDDNEGFFVYEGRGYAFVGDEEQEISAGTVFYAPAGAPHGIKCAEDCEVVKVFLYHWPAK